MKGKVVFSGRSLAKTHANLNANKKQLEGKKQVSKQRKQR